MTRILSLACLMSVCLAAHADGGDAHSGGTASNADALFCRQVFIEFQEALTAAGQKADADFAIERGLALYAFEENLQQADRPGYAAARRDADARFSAIPQGPRRPAAMRAAYEQCLAAEGADAPPSAAAHLAAEQRYCAKLMGDIAADMREMGDELDASSRAAMVALERASNAIGAAEAGTKLSAADRRDAGKLQQRMDADLDARLGKAGHDQVLDAAVEGCFVSYDAGKLGGK